MAATLVAATLEAPVPQGALEAATGVEAELLPHAGTLEVALTGVTEQEVVVEV